MRFLPRRASAVACALLATLALAGCSPGDDAKDDDGNGGNGGENGTGDCPQPPPPLVDASADDPRRTVELADEAGFVDVPAQDDCLTFPSRMFYSFRPADEAPGAKPLLVLFNGGPGFPTTLGLLPWGTGPRTLAIPEGGTPEDAEWKRNPHSFTRFANLLYIDEAQTGFSYGRGAPPDDPCPQAARAFAWADAVTFVRVVLEFLESHPALERAPVVLLGESYGAYRALHMLDLLLNHEELRSDHPDIAERIAQHFRRTQPKHSGPFAPEDVARQFGNLASIQGAFHSAMRFGFEPLCPGPVPETLDVHDVSKPTGWTDAADARAARLWVEEAESNTLLGQPLAAVIGLTTPQRGQAFRSPTNEGGEVGQTIISAGLAEKLGELPEGDDYFGAMTGPGVLAWAESEREPVFRVLPHVRTFATHALHDRVVCTDTVLNNLGKLWGRLRMDDKPRDSEERPGRAVLGEPQSECSFSLRVPTYAESGHAVSASQPRELAEDLEAWLRAD